MTSADTPRVRRDILIEAQRFAQEIDLAEDELEVFRGRDVPAFAAWFDGRFVDERRHLAELERSLATLVQRHNHVVALSKMQELALERAYRLILEEDAAFARGNPATRRHIREERRRREDFLREDLEREVRTRLRTGAPAARPAADPAGPVDGDVKGLYRKLVRRLHPDVRGDVSCPNELRWQRRVWSLLQAAYDNGDASVLANLYRVTLLRQMDFAELTLDDARRVHAWLSRERDALVDERERARRRPSWGFGLITSFDDLSARVREEFRLDANTVRTEIDEIQGQHEYLALLAKRGGTATVEARARRPRRAGTSVNQLSLFD